MWFHICESPRSGQNRRGREQNGGCQGLGGWECYLMEREFQFCNIRVLWMGGGDDSLAE